MAAPLSAGSHPNSNAPGRRREDDENLAIVQGEGPVVCVYCGEPTGTVYDEHEECVEASMEAAADPVAFPALGDGDTTGAIHGLGTGNHDRQHGLGVVVEPTGFRGNAGSRGVDASRGTSPSIMVGTGVGVPSPPAVMLPAAAVSQNQRNELRETDVSMALQQPGGKPGQGSPVMRQGTIVRRLSPVECERLMSWPDGWTAVDGEDTPVGRRYAACGDGVVSNVSEWVARGILAVDAEMGAA